MLALTPDQWRDALIAELAQRQERLELYEDYYGGEHRLQFATSKFREAFGDLFEAFATNWCGLVVDVAVERLNVLGFRFGSPKSSSTPPPRSPAPSSNGNPPSTAPTPAQAVSVASAADADAWRFWQENGLDAGSRMAHTLAVKTGYAYLIVGPPRKPGAAPRITVEHPSQVIVAHDPNDRRERLAALKLFTEIDGTRIAVVYLPDRIVEWRQSLGAVTRLVGLGVQLPVGYGPGAWEPPTVSPNPTGVVPVVPLENNPDALKGGQSDLLPAISLNDAANKFFMDMIHASEFTSFPQRVLTGVELPRDPITGDVLDDAQVRAAVSRLWAFEDPKAAVTQLSPGDMTGYMQGVEMSVQHLAAQTRTPPHYLLAKMANLSADALIAAESGLVHRCMRMHVDFGETWEEAIRVGFLWKGDPRRGNAFDAETIWAHPENRDPVSLSQSLTMRQAIGVPQEILWEEAGYTPQQIERMLELRAVEVQRQADVAAKAAEQARQLAVAHAAAASPVGSAIAGTPKGSPKPPKPPPKSYVPPGA